MLPEYSKKEKKEAEDTVYQHIIKDYNSRGNLGSANGVEMPTDLRNAILYESTFEECIWGRADWTDLSGNGCSFSSCDFYSNNIYNAALQHALFESAVLYRCDMRSSNFAYNLFTWSVLDNCSIEGCSFTGAVFNHVTLNDCQIAHSNFELCTFQSSMLRNIDFRNLALKYTFFHDVHMENVAVPFMQMPYTFGGLKYVFSTNDPIKIASMRECEPNITVEEYRKTLFQLVVFFSSHNDFFPLANCYLALGKQKLAEEANETGIKTSAAVHDFRKLYFFCIQASQELGLPREKLHYLYEQIHRAAISTRFTQAEYHEFRHYFPLIKQLMFDNPHNRPTLAISLHTNIAADDFHNLGLLMKTLDEIAEKCGAKLDSKHIEIRHNSPNILGWFPTGDINSLLQLLQDTWEIIYPVLSATLQDASNVVALITGGITIHSVIGDRKKKKKGERKTETGRQREEKRESTFMRTSCKKLSAEEAEVLRLRATLLKQENTWWKNAAMSTTKYKTSLKNIKDSFNERIEELKASGICIESLEVQLLDDRCDTLELLYNSEVEHI